MSLSVNNRNFSSPGRYDKKMTQALKSAFKDKRKRSDSVDASKSCKEWTSLSYKKVTAIDNAVRLNDPFVDFCNEVGRIVKVTPTGTIQWEIPEDAAEDMESTLFEDLNFDDYVFWSRLTDDPTFLGLSYSDKGIRNRLSNAGIKPGFFTVTVDSKSYNQFYSQAKGASAVYSKEQYDQRYNHMLSENFLKDYKVGQKFLIGGKEYTLSEDRKLDIPYGADIYDFKRLID